MKARRLFQSILSAFRAPRGSTKKQQVLVGVLALALLLALAAVVSLTYAQEPKPQSGANAQASPVGTAFTYQGQLKSGGEPVDGTCDFQFGLYDAASLGNQIGITQTESITVADGLFTVNLDFGDVFTGTAPWLGIRVMCTDLGDTEYADLGRQELTATPYAHYARSTGALQGHSVSTMLPEMGQVLEWDGSAWVPAADDDTTYTAGVGLVLTDTAFSADTGYLQRRVSGECGEGNAIRVIRADGTVVCQTDAPLNRPVAPAPNTLTTLDSAGTVGRGTSVTIGADGLGLTSYWGGNSLKVAHCNDLACTSATVTTLDTVGGPIPYTSVTIGADGLGLISYYDVNNGDLKMAHCNDVACISATITTLDSTGDVGRCSSVTIGADGLGLTSYWADSGLRVAHCNDLACTAATITTLGDLGYDTSVVIGADGLGLISYGRVDYHDLKVAHCSSITCTSATISTLDTTCDVDCISLAIGADGLGLISYWDETNGDLKVAHCDNLACTSAITTTLDSMGDVGKHTSITVGADGLGLISYYDDTNDELKVAHCSDLACTAATTTTLDSAGDVGRETCVTIGVDGLGLISYYDYTNYDLKVAHCSNTFCVPYFRRR